jgi:hypothetical protein
MKSVRLSFLFFTMVMVTTVVAFTPASLSRKCDIATSSSSVHRNNVPTLLFAGGYGSAGVDKSPKKKGTTKESSKLKPKQQWGRYQDMKGETKIRVAIRCKEDDDESSKEWLEVGLIKSKESQYTVVAVARQRALIAEVSKCIQFYCTWDMYVVTKR